MPSTNFLQWNPGAANQETDAEYAADSQRTGGAISGRFPSKTANKVFYQASTMAKALADMLVNKGYSPNDSNLSTLEGVLANLVTFADLKSGLTNVPFATTMAFDASNTNGFEIDLAGTVTSSTLTGFTVGQVITFVIVQPGSPQGFTPPPNVSGWIAINPLPFTTSVQQFIVRSDGTIWPISTEIALLITLINQIETTISDLTTYSQIDKTGSNSFGVNYQNTSDKPIEVAVSGIINFGPGGTATIQALTGTSVPTNVVATSSITNSSGLTSITFKVLPGYWYRVNTGGIGPGDSHSATLSSWIEWS